MIVENLNWTVQIITNEVDAPSSSSFISIDRASLDKKNGQIASLVHLLLNSSGLGSNSNKMRDRSSRYEVNWELRISVAFCHGVSTWN